jgi:hypothetical protein
MVRSVDRYAYEGQYRGVRKKPRQAFVYWTYSNRALLLRWRSATTGTTALTPLLHASLHALLILCKLLFLAIVQNGFDLCVGVAANALHLCLPVFRQQRRIRPQRSYLLLLGYQNGLDLALLIGG